MRGNVVMQGYFNDPEATELASLRGGWVHSGDAAVVHPDGYVEIRDRLKDVIIRGGENISSVEVGAVLLRASYLRVAVDRVRMLEQGFEDTSGKFWIKVIKEQRLKDINAPLLQKALYRQRLTW